MHGHELYKLLAARDVEDWAPISRAQVYYSIRKLAEGGFILATEDNTTSQGPERVVYAPAPHAAQEMDRTLSETTWTEKRPPPPFITWAALALNAQPSTVKKQIARRRRFLQAELEREQQTLNVLEKEKGRDAGVARVMIAMVIGQFESELAQLEDLEKALLRK
jgi:DNA-binding PadR family transcriptional regulator